jgi:hypothetical protein
LKLYPAPAGGENVEAIADLDGRVCAVSLDGFLATGRRFGRDATHRDLISGLESLIQLADPSCVNP